MQEHYGETQARKCQHFKWIAMTASAAGLDFTKDANIRRNAVEATDGARHGAHLCAAGASWRVAARYIASLRRLPVPRDFRDHSSTVHPSKIVRVLWSFIAPLTAGEAASTIFMVSTLTVVTFFDRVDDVRWDRHCSSHQSLGSLTCRRFVGGNAVALDDPAERRAGAAGSARPLVGNTGDGDAGVNSRGRSWLPTHPQRHRQVAVISITEGRRWFIIRPRTARTVCASMPG